MTKTLRILELLRTRGPMRRSQIQMELGEQVSQSTLFYLIKKGCLGKAPLDGPPSFYGRLPNVYRYVRPYAPINTRSSFGVRMQERRRAERTLKAPAQPIVRLLRAKDAYEITGHKRSTFYDQVKSGLMPPPVGIGGRAVAWPDYELNAINRARIAGKTEEEIRALVKEMVAARAPSRT